MADPGRLHFAVIVPPFVRGSGGHGTIFTLLDRLEQMGHTCSVWVYDPLNDCGNTRVRDTAAAVVERISRRSRRRSRRASRLARRRRGGRDRLGDGLPALLRESCRARAYLVQDHEPEFFPASARRLWAEQTYSLGLHPICASRWLRDLLARRYGSDGQLVPARRGPPHLHRAARGEAPTRHVIFYARSTTPRRAVPLGAARARGAPAPPSGLRIVTFGHTEPLPTALSYEQLGVATPGQLALTTRRRRSGSACRLRTTR